MNVPELPASAVAIRDFQHIAGFKRGTRFALLPGQEDKPMFEYEADTFIDDEDTVVREDLFADDDALDAWEWATDEGIDLSF